MSESTDKIHNGDFSVAEGTLPQGWTVHKHPINPNLTPTFKLRINKDNQKPELVAYNQQRECYGYVYQTCTLDAGDYVFQVELTIHNMQDLNRHVVSAIFDDEAPTAFNTGIVEYRNENGVAKGEVRFHCDKQRRVQIRLYFRYSPEIHAEVHWRRVSLRKLEVPIAKRCVTIVCADLKADSSKPALDSPPGYDKWLKHWGESAEQGRC